MKKILFTLVISLLAITANAQVNDLLNNVKKQKAPDTRVAVWDVIATEKNGIYDITGKVDNPESKAAIDATLTANGVKYNNKVVVLPTNDIKEKWALVKLPIAHLRTKTGNEQELTSQALMGMPLRIIEKDDSWYRVQTPDNYISWVNGSSIQRLNDTQFDVWKKAKRYIVTKNISSLFLTADDETLVTELVLGDVLAVADSNTILKNRLKLATPDGRIGFVNASDVIELSTWANQKYNPQLILKTAYSILGSCYTWGGTSPKGVDCSGLVKICYYANGIILQRDASQQALYGKILKPENWKQANAGDLLFFGSSKGKVTHVAIYIQDGKYIHSSGQVKINSVDPKELDYLTTPFLSISQIDGNLNTKGIVTANKHPWYF